MGWLDNFLGSSAIVYIILFLVGLNMYLHKTGKTFPEWIRETIEKIKGWGVFNNDGE